MKDPLLICGAGIAGISAAYFLSVRYGVENILLVDENPPLSLTSDHSTECYRNWWPDPAMVQLMSRSITLIEELAHISGNAFHLNRRGYLYGTADPEQAARWEKEAAAITAAGAGELRRHPGASSYLPAPSEGFQGQPDGADLIVDRGLIQRHFPYLAQNVSALLHVRRAGWLSAQQLGMYLLQQARQHGVRLMRARLTAVQCQGGEVRSVELFTEGADPPVQRMAVRGLINAAGPYLAEVGQMLGIELPVYHELHLKAAIAEPRGVIPRHAPLLIWSDPQYLPWSPEEHQMLSEEPQLAWLLEKLPAGAHTRPEGGPDSQTILLLWELHSEPTAVVYPLPEDPFYGELALRGLIPLVPGLAAYLQKIPRPRLDGGYYTKTRENRPLIGKLPVQGAYIIGALSGFGIMASCGAGELLAAHVVGVPLPSYAADFSLDRYSDPAYLQRLEQWGESGQL